VKVNAEKTVTLWIKPTDGDPDDPPDGATEEGDQDRLADLQIRKTIKITGIHHGGTQNAKEVEKLNYNKLIAKMEAQFNMWKQRELLLLGRAQVIKAQGLSLLQYIASTIKVPEWVIWKLNVIIYGFLWNGPDKLPRPTMEKGLEGGLKLPRPSTLDVCPKLKWLQRSFTSTHPWTFFLERNIEKGLRN